MNLILSLLLLVSLATAKDTAVSKKSIAKNSIVNYKDALTEARMTLTTALPAEEQWKAYKAALQVFCDSFKSEEAKKVNTFYLTELLLLASTMYEIDSGKRPTDCFAGYYALNAATIDKVITFLPTKQQDILQSEIINAKSAFGRQ